ncbi:hypothetical protein [Falsiroseomonas sp.]|uniref:hypothetical protein n=1 Tax=Falsiroseomonas sp. TaxID=2870721 RepID=UPI002733619C|nr:hypothetical protein [Falsiroseomonas sp.]MDP3418974.1 hypothetical protein [Falsiroseomonas sp.]
MQLLIDRIMLASRHVLVVFFLGLGVALAIYALGFLAKLWKFAGNALAGSDNRHSCSTCCTFSMPRWSPPWW